jgi:zinc transport system permease protein
MSLFNYDFMVRAFLAITAMALFAPVLGVFLVLRRQSLMSDTLSHVSLAGVAFGIFLGVNPTLTTLITVVLAAILLEYLRTVYRHFLEVSTAILMSVGLSVALIISRLSGGKSAVSLDQYLFGSIFTVSEGQVYLLFGLAALVLILFSLFLRPLYIMTFDEDTAFVEGLPVRLMSASFNIITGIAIALMIPIAGALLVSAIMILPASIAIRVGKSFKSTLILSVVFGFIGMSIGPFVSFYTDAPASASITLIFVAMFVLVHAVPRLLKK